MSTRRPKKNRGGRRPGSGRPPVYEDPVRFLVTLERAEKEALEELAEDREQSVASLVREALTALLKRRRR